MKTHHHNIDKFIEHNQEYKYLIKRVEEASLKVEQFNSFKILDFVDQHQSKIIADAINHFTGVTYQLVSKIVNSERKLLVIYADKVAAPDFSEMTALLKIKYNDKFSHLDHRDALGSILNSNIERRLLGDIVEDKGMLYFEVSTSIRDYLINNVNKIKNSKVVLEETTASIERHDEFKSKIHIIKSERLDVVVKAITKLSRNDSKEYILQDNVKVNQMSSDNFSLNVSDGDILSLKGYGRFLIHFKANKTKKGNIIMVEHKYV